jgi:hypothetical protein
LRAWRAIDELEALVAARIPGKELRGSHPERKACYGSHDGIVA